MWLVALCGDHQFAVAAASIARTIVLHRELEPTTLEFMNVGKREWFYIVVANAQDPRVGDIATPCDARPRSHGVRVRWRSIR